MKAAADVEALPPPAPMTPAQWRTYVVYRLVWAVVAWAPAAVARRVPRVVGRLWHRRAGGQRRLVRRHIARIRPTASDAELEQLTEAAFVSYVRYWVDAFRLHRTAPEEVLHGFTGERLDVVDEALADGEGAILATAHHGSWDIGGLWSVARGWPMVVVAEVLEPRRLFDRFVALRRGAGMGVIPLLRGGDMLDRLTRVVQDGGLATLLADRDLTGKGPVVSFFGEPCRLPPGAAALARRTGRPVAVGAFMTDGDGYRGVIVGDAMDLSELSVQEGTQRVAEQLELLIGRFPEQWHVFVPHWLVDREPDHPAVAAWRRDPEGWMHDASWREAA